MTNKTIAVLSDNDHYLKAQAALLNAEGYQASPYRFLSADGAYKRILEEQPDLVTLDLRIHMGGTNAGFELLKLLRSDPATANLSIILCTGDGWILKQRPGLVEHLNCNMLEKPYEPEQLLSLISQLLAEQERQQAERAEHQEQAEQVESETETALAE